MVPVLLATFLFGPIGYLAFLLLRASFGSARNDRIARALAAAPAWLRAVEFEPRLTAAGLAMAALIVPTLLAYAIDPRTFQGVNVWLKPLKFEISIALYLLTLALCLPLTSRAFSASWLGRFTVWPVIVLIWFEIVYIGWRASRAEASHYNRDSWLDAALYDAMGAAAVTFTLAAGAMAYGLARRDAARIAPVLRWSLVIGLRPDLHPRPRQRRPARQCSRTFRRRRPGGASDACRSSAGRWRSAICASPISSACTPCTIIPAFGLLVWLLTRQARTGVLALGAFSAAYALVTVAALVAALNARPLLGLG